MDNSIDLFSRYLSFAGLGSWVFQVFCVVLVTLLLNFVLKRVFRRILATLENTRTVWDHSLFDAMRVPLRAFLWVVALAFVLKILRTQTEAVIFEAVGPIRDITMIAILAWFLVRFIRKADSKTADTPEGEYPGETEAKRLKDHERSRDDHR